MKLRVLAIITMVFAGGAAVVAQHGPEPKAHAEPAPAAKAPEPAAKASDTKGAEAKVAEGRRGASASPLQTAAAIEQILRKLREEGATAAPVRRAPREATRPQLRLTWRLSLTWPSEVLPAKTAP